MLRKNKQSNAGFTIIEVLIVLAIVGLIMLIVFLAVPRLQRNAHNTQQRNDVAALLSGWTEFVNNNGGTTPVTWDSTNTEFKASGSGGNPASIKLGYYDPANISIVAYSSDTMQAPDEDHVGLVKGAVCNSTSTGIAKGTTRSVAAYYTLEGGAKQCQAS